MARSTEEQPLTLEADIITPDDLEALAKELGWEETMAVLGQDQSARLVDNNGNVTGLRELVIQLGMQRHGI